MRVGRLRQAGLTLLELVVTLLVLTMVTGIAIRSTSELQDQTRFEQTRERLGMIRDAILGQADAGGAGFLADMGRPPANLHELLERQYCPDRRYATAAECDAALGAGSWVLLPSWGWDSPSPSGLARGWRGPYLRISGNPRDDTAFADGWGNAPAGPTDQNYGWRLTPDPPALGTDLVITSLGANRQADPALGCGEAQHFGDCSLTLPASRQQVTVTDAAGNGGILVRLVKPAVHTDACDLPIQTAPVCTALGGTWGGSPPSCTDAPALCAALAGAWDAVTSLCQDVDVPRSPCQGYGGTWTAPAYPQSLCLRLYHRQDGAIVHVNSGAAVVKADGGEELRVFGFAAPTALPAGGAAAAVHRYDTVAGACTGQTEPAGRSPVPLVLAITSGPPAIDWSLLP